MNTLIMNYKILFPLLAGLCAAVSTLRAQDCASGYCPESITVHHVAGDISPETVTITYPVVETTLGSSDGSVNCWIAQNLGATTQASSATDATAAASGWYWIFNQKQGYAHDGSTRTPDDGTWVTGAVDREDSDWESANDPCQILLGGQWRLPTNTKWVDADGSSGGSWSSYSNTYSSVLKIHAAGQLREANGAVYQRGTYGYYWSSTQNTSNSNYGQDFRCSSSVAQASNNSYKATAEPLRCLSEL